MDNNLDISQGGLAGSNIAVPNAKITPSSNTSSSTDMQALNLTHALALAEHGGKINYTTAGDSGTSAGAYQWHSSDGSGGMSHFASDAKNANLDPNDFSPMNQDKVAYAKVKAMKDKGLTPAEIASTWNSGSPNNWQNHRKVDSTGKVVYDTPAYVKNVQKYFNQLSGQQNGMVTPPPLPTAITSPLPDDVAKKNEEDKAYYHNKGFLGNLGDVFSGVGKSVGQTVVGAGKIGESMLDNTVGRLMNGGQKPVQPAEVTAVANNVDDYLKPKNFMQAGGDVIGQLGQLALGTGEISDTLKLPELVKAAQESSLAVKAGKAVGSVGKIYNFAKKAAVPAGILYELVRNPTGVLGAIKKLNNFIDSSGTPIP